MIDEKIEKNAHVRKLDVILNDQDAKAAFLEDGSNEALAILSAKTVANIDSDKLTFEEITDLFLEGIKNLDPDALERMKRDPDGNEVSKFRPKIGFWHCWFGAMSA